MARHAECQTPIADPTRSGPAVAIVVDESAYPIDLTIRKPYLVPELSGGYPSR